jgi:hypothetical protein
MTTVAQPKKNTNYNFHGNSDLTELLQCVMIKSYLTYSEGGYNASHGKRVSHSKGGLAKTEVVRGNCEAIATSQGNAWVSFRQFLAYQAARTRAVHQTTEKSRTNRTIRGITIVLPVVPLLPIDFHPLSSRLYRHYLMLNYTRLPLEKQHEATRTEQEVVSRGGLSPMLNALTIASHTMLTVWDAEEYLDLLHHIHSLGVFGDVDIADLHSAMLAEADEQRLDPRFIGYRVLREANQQGVAV